jgi:hypothetical protein
MEYTLDKEYWEDHFNYSQLYCNTVEDGNDGEVFTLRLEGIQADIIETKNAAAASFFTLDTNFEPHKMQKVILESNDPKYLYFFAKFVPNADIKALQKALFDSSNKEKLHYLCQFARFIPNANIRKIEALIVKMNEAHFAYFLLRYVKGVNSDKLKSIILSSGKPRYLYFLAKQLTSRKEIAQIEKLIIKSKSFLYIRLFAQHIKYANIEKLEQVILDSGSAREIKKFAKAVSSSKSRHLSILF